MLVVVDPSPDCDDPFSCFDSGESSDDDDQQDDTCGDINDSAPNANIVPDVERGRRLVEANNVRQISASTEHLPLHSSDYEVFDDRARGRGMGVRALRSFCAGDEIMREGAAMRVPRRLHATNREEADTLFAGAVGDAFEALSPATQDAAMSLSSCKEEDNGVDNSTKTPRGIYETNCYALGDETDAGLFLTVSRMNHSCRPNANHIWRPDLQKTVIFAARDIGVGDDICTSYGPSECLGTSGRRDYLRDRFAFECQCEMCMEGNDSGGDDRMIEFKSLNEDIAMYAATGQPEIAIRTLDRCLALLDEQGIGTWPVVKSILHYGYQISLTGLHDVVLARSYLARELLAVKSSEGVDCYKAVDIQNMLNDLDAEMKA